MIKLDLSPTVTRVNTDKLIPKELHSSPCTSLYDIVSIETFVSHETGTGKVGQELLGYND